MTSTIMMKVIIVLVIFIETSILSVQGFTVGNCISASNTVSACRAKRFTLMSSAQPDDFAPFTSWPTVTLADVINSQDEALDMLSVDDSVDIVDLPPPYVPLLIAALILVGVGLLTGSLGDVYSEGKDRIIYECNK